jgi:hypothetical protein
MAGRFGFVRRKNYAGAEPLSTKQGQQKAVFAALQQRHLT